MIWAIFARIAAAQSLSFSEPFEIPAKSNVRAAVTEMDVASNGRGFVIAGRFSGRLITTAVSPHGEPAPPALLSFLGNSPVIASSGDGYLAVWKMDYRIAVAQLDANGSKTSESIVARDQLILDGEAIRLAATDDRYLLLWSVRWDLKRTLRAAMFDRAGRQVSNVWSIGEIEDVALGVARAGSNFIVACHTTRGIETFLITADGITAAQHVIASGASPLSALFVVTTPLGAMVLFSPQTGGTYAISLNDRGESSDLPEPIVSGTIFDAIEVNGRPVILVRDRSGVRAFRIPLLGIARELRIPAVSTEAVIAWNGANVLIARGAPVAEVMLATIDGRAISNATAFAFTPVNQSPVDAATAGGVDLIAWRETIIGQPSYIETPKAGRFRNGVALDGLGLQDLRYDYLASDGTSTFLAVGGPYASVLAQIIPVEGAPSRPIVLGAGTPLDVIWDGQDFIVFWQDAHQNLDAPCWPVESVLYAARVRRDGTVVTPEGGFVLIPHVGHIYSLHATPTPAGFILAWHMIAAYRPVTCIQMYRSHVAAYSSNFSRLSDIDLPVESAKESWILAIAGDGNDRALVGATTFLLGYATSYQRETFVVNSHGEQQFFAKNGPHAAIWTHGAFVMMLPGDERDEAVLWDGAGTFDDARLASPPVPVDVKQSVPILATSPDRTIAVYPVRVSDPLRFDVTRIMLREITVLPKPEAAP
ncbi:MAG: hypothetical protein DMF56_09005 [Acidobacteria bacterium]|nr:MAG: hypothetical protein DMF56_09005 [Acidobacteriota bacterium]